MTAEPALPLIYPEQPNPPPRPRHRDDVVLRAAAKSLLPEIVEWLGNRSLIPEKDGKENLAEIEEQLFGMLEATYEPDGFRLARWLDDKCHWECDAALVEILDATRSHVWDAERELVRAWVVANGIRPKFAIGDIVRTPHGTGPIGQVLADDAEYIVQTDEYLRDNPDQAQYRTSGFMIPFDRCELASREAADAASGAVLQNKDGEL